MPRITWSAEHSPKKSGSPCTAGKPGMLLPQEAAVSFRRTQRNVRSGNAKPRSKKASAAQRRTPRASSHSSVRASIVSGSEWPQWQWHLGDGFDTAGRSAGHGASPWSSFRFASSDGAYEPGAPRAWSDSPAGPIYNITRPARLIPKLRVPRLLYVNGETGCDAPLVPREY